MDEEKKASEILPPTEILAQNGYAVSWGKEKRSGKTGYVYFVKYWRPEDEREDAR